MAQGIKKPPWARTRAVFCMAEKALRFGSRCCFALRQLFFDTCRLAAAVTQVVQLGAANITTTLDFDALYPNGQFLPAQEFESNSFFELRPIMPRYTRGVLCCKGHAFT
jgi:hypothetical protein